MAVEESLVLYAYWQSSCTWRVRLAMAFKGLNFEYRAVNIVKGEQFDKGFLQRNPLGMVPVLEVEGALIADSIAILEFLEERYPDKRALLPKNWTLRAAVRQFVAAVSSSIQPLQNLRVLNWVEDKCGAEERLHWVQHWIITGFQTLEESAKLSAGKYCFGDDVTLADVALIPQLASAVRFNVDMSDFPTLSRIGKALYELPEVQESVPKNQPDAPQS